MSKSARGMQILWILLRPAMALAVVATVFASLARPVRDADVFWHLKAGEWMLQHGAIPRTDPFSWTVAGRAWTAHEWASELAYSVVLRAGGAWLLVCFGVLLVVGALACVAVRLGNESGNRLGPVTDPAIWPVLLVVAVGLMPGLHLRPQLFSYLFFALTLALLDRRAYLWLIPMAALWVNVHGMFILLPALLGLHGLVQMWDRRSLCTWPFPAWVTAVVGALATPIVTPYGTGLYHYVWATLTDPQMQAFIVEWQSPDFHTVGLPFAIALLGTVVLSRALAVSWSTWETALWVVFGFFGLMAGRNIPLFFLALAPVWYRVGRAILDRYPGFRIMAVRAAVGAIAVLLAAVAIPRHARAPLVSGPQPGQPNVAVEYLLAHPERQRVFNHYNFGGYLIWRGIPVAVDGRADLYVPDVMRDALEVQQADRWQAILNRYRPDAVLWYAGEPLAGYLAGDETHWEKVVEADDAVLFLRKGD